MTVDIITKNRDVMRYHLYGATYRNILSAERKFSFVSFCFLVSSISADLLRIPSYDILLIRQITIICPDESKVLSSIDNLHENNTMMKRFVFGMMILGSFLLMANSSGRGRPAVGAPGDSQQTCGSFGCHSGSTFLPELEISLINSTNGQSVTEYVPGREYSVVLKTDHSGSPSGFGFQIVSLKDEDESGINNFSDFESGIDEFINRTRQYVEHTRVLRGDSISVKWTAPEAGTGSVTFYGCMNMVNGDGGSAGDSADTTSFTITEKLNTSVNLIEKNKLKFYPNPTSGQINFTQSYSQVLVRDMKGKIVANSSNTNQLDVSELVSGVYLIETLEKDQRIIERLIKI